MITKGLEIAMAMGDRIQPNHHGWRIYELLYSNDMQLSIGNVYSQFATVWNVYSDLWICQIALEGSGSEMTGWSSGTSSELLIPEEQSLGVCSWSRVSFFSEAPSESITEGNDFCVWSCRLPSSFPLQTIICSLSKETRMQGTRSCTKTRGWQVYSIYNTYKVSPH